MILEAIDNCSKFYDKFESIENEIVLEEKEEDNIEKPNEEENNEKKFNEENSYEENSYDDDYKEF